MATPEAKSPASIPGADSDPGDGPANTCNACKRRLADGTSGPIAVENPILSSETEPTGHLASPLFKKLPTELRLMIYKLAFQGSNIRFWTGEVDGNEPYGRDRHRFVISTHYRLLAACRAIYHEAINTFWSSTQLHITSRTQGLCRSILYLFGAIPAYVMASAKRVHLQDGTFLRCRPRFLVLSPQSQVCELAPGYWDSHQHRVTSMDTFSALVPMGGVGTIVRLKTSWTVVCMSSRPSSPRKTWAREI